MNTHDTSLVLEWLTTQATCRALLNNNQKYLIPRILTEVTCLRFLLFVVSAVKRIKIKVSAQKTEM